MPPRRPHRLRRARRRAARLAVARAMPVIPSRVEWIAPPSGFPRVSSDWTLPSFVRGPELGLDARSAGRLLQRGSDRESAAPWA